MPIISLPDHRALSQADEPAKVVGLTILAVVQCSCGAQTQLGLVNAQPTICESCGAVFSLDAVTWEKGSLTPSIRLSAAPSRAKALLS